VERKLDSKNFYRGADFYRGGAESKQDSCNKLISLEADSANRGHTDRDPTEGHILGDVATGSFGGVGHLFGF